MILNACCSVTTVQTASSSKTICQRRLGFDAINLLADLSISFYTAFKVACDIRHGLPGVLIKQPTIKLTHEKKAVDNFRKRRGGICVFEQSWTLSQQRDFKFEEFENGDAKVHPHLGRWSWCSCRDKKKANCDKKHPEYFHKILKNSSKLVPKLQFFLNFKSTNSSTFFLF